MLIWRASRQHYYAGPYVIVRNRRASWQPRGWAAYKQGPINLGVWPSFAHAAAACELDWLLNQGVTTYSVLGKIEP